MNNLKKHNGFSLAEALITLLITSVIITATLPIVTIRTKVDPNKYWKLASNHSDIYYGNGGASSSVGIGTDTPVSKLMVVSDDHTRVPLMVIGGTNAQPEDYLQMWGNSDDYNISNPDSFVAGIRTTGDLDIARFLKIWGGRIDLKPAPNNILTIAGYIKPDAGYQSSDGSEGITGTKNVAVGDSVVIENGIITSWTP